MTNFTRLYVDVLNGFLSSYPETALPVILTHAGDILIETRTNVESGIQPYKLPVNRQIVSVITETDDEVIKSSTSVNPHWELSTIDLFNIYFYNLVHPELLNRLEGTYKGVKEQFEHAIEKSVEINKGMMSRTRRSVEYHWSSVIQWATHTFSDIIE